MRDQLRALFAERAQFEQEELARHGQTAGIPRVWGSILQARPSAVVWPERTEEVVELVHLAAGAGFSLVPRGGATSPWGGALPVRGAVAVNFSRMNRVLAVDPTAQTVTVEPGAGWDQVDEALTPKGLALRLLPTSAPLGTVGGWVAEDGAGLGSYQYGYLHANLESVQVVTGTGEVLDLAGDQLRLVCGLEGITGLITRITLKVAREAPLHVWALGYLSQDDLIRALHGIFDADWPLWHVAFRNATASREVPWGVNRDGAADDLHLLVLMSRHPDRKGLQRAIEQLARATRGHLFSPDQATAEWEDRFAGLEPGLNIPGAWQTRLVLPRYGLAPLFEDLADLRHPIALQGVGVLGGEVALHAVAPADLAPRQAGKLLATLEDRVSRYGGHPYAIGLLKAHEAARILGPAQMRELIAWKRRYDPKQVLNPGKVLPVRGINWRVRAALAWSSWFGGIQGAAMTPEPERVYPRRRAS